MAGLALAGCSASRSITPLPTAPTSVLSRAVPPAPPNLAPPPARPAFVPAQPSSRRHTFAAHAGFFAGEAALSNGVYYLAIPNGTAFGYYAYLPDTNYIYHFDLGYEYVVDAADGKGGVYLYDFASSHWLYTGLQYPFPYVYDFSLNAYLYYYPNAASAGRYTANPRYFYNFTASAIITLPGTASTPAPTATPAVTPAPTPSPTAAPGSLAASPSNVQIFGLGSSYAQRVTIFGATGTLAESDSCASIATIGAVGGGAYSVTGTRAGSCSATFTDGVNAGATVPITVTLTTITGS